MGSEGYKRLDIYKLAHALAVEVHTMGMTLPKHEMYEEGSQIRRSSKSVSCQIVEGFGLRKYKNDFLLYLYRAFASATETMEHLEILRQTQSLNDDALYSRYPGATVNSARSYIGSYRALKKIISVHSRSAISRKTIIHNPQSRIYIPSCADSFPL
jgi:four helix bundle protein